MPLHREVTRPTASAHQVPLSPFIVLASSKGNMLAMCVSTDSLSLAGSTHPSTVTSTISSGKIKKKAQKAIIAAMLVD